MANNTAYKWLVWLCHIMYSQLTANRYNSLAKTQTKSWMLGPPLSLTKFFQICSSVGWMLTIHFSLFQLNTKLLWHYSKFTSPYNTCSKKFTSQLVFFLSLATTSCKWRFVLAEVWRPCACACMIYSLGARARQLALHAFEIRAADLWAIPHS